MRFLERMIPLRRYLLLLAWSSFVLGLSVGGYLKQICGIPRESYIFEWWSQTPLWRDLVFVSIYIIFVGISVVMIIWCERSWKRR